MFTTARRHGLPLPSPSSKHDRQKLKQAQKDKPPALSAPTTPNNVHTHAQAYAARPATAAAAPASFSRATGWPLAHANAPARPLTAGAGAGATATHLPSSVPQTFPTPVPSPAPSPSAQAPLRLAIPRASASACATPSPLSSGLPSPTLPPLPPAHLPSQPIAITPAHVRSPVINIGSASPLAHHAHNLKKDEFDYRVAMTRPVHTRQFSVSTSSGSASSPNSPNSPLDPSSPASRGSGSSVREDVLAPGDRVGAGLALQGEVLRRVLGEDKDKEEPAAELEVVRRLGAGSYAIVYLVREVLSRAPSGILDGLDRASHSDDDSISGHYGDRVDDFGFWDSSDMDMDGLELDGMWRKKSLGTDVSEDGRDKVFYGKSYAVKVLSKAGMDEEALEAQLVEANIHQSLPTHPNIVTLHRALETASFLLLVLEFVPGEDLYYFLEQARDHYEPEPRSSGSASSEGEGSGHKANTSVLSVSTVGTMNTTRTPPTPSLLSTLNEKQLLGRRRLRLIASMFAQMCEAVAVCHDVGVYHRDIKPENFIVTDGWDEDGARRVVVVKLTDFGLSTRDAASSDMDCGSAPYMSYECRNNCAPTYAPRAADVWSLGIVLINMLYHINPWTDTTQGVCPSFSAFLAAPELFFMQRFAGMVPAVASFLCRRVFCVLPSDDPADSAGRRVDARALGQWARELPRLMASEEPVGVPPALADPAMSSLVFPVAPASILVESSSAKETKKDTEREKEEMLPSPTSASSALLAQSLAAVLAQQEAASAAAGSSSPAWRHRRGLSNASVGYALSSVPQSRRPASRQQSFSAERAPHLGLSGLGPGMGMGMGPGSAAGSRAATPLLRGRALGSTGPRSRVPSSCEPPAPTLGVSELPTVFDEGEGDVSSGSLGLELGLGTERARDERDEQYHGVLEEDEQEQEREQYGEMEQDQEHEQEQEQEQDGEDEDSISRSTSIVRRRKRGARRGKGQIIQQQQMEIARLQQQQSELARQVQLMQEQLQKQTQAQVIPSSSPTTPTGPSDTLDSLASASEALARELSRTRNPRGPPVSPPPVLVNAHSYSHLQASSLSHALPHLHSHPHPHSLPHSQSLSHSQTSQLHSVSHSQVASAPVSVPHHNQSTNSHLSPSSSLNSTASPVSAPVPVPMRAISSTSMGTRDASPSPSRVSTLQASPAAAMALAAAGGPTPGAMFPVSFASRTSSAGSATRRSQKSSSSASASTKASATEAQAGAENAFTSTPTAAAPAIAKKTSKWKLSFGKGSSTAHSRAPLPPQIRTETQTGVIDIIADGDDRADAPQSGSAQHDASAGSGAGQSQVASPTMGSENGNESWSRGRRPAGSQQAWSPATLSTDRWVNTERERNVSPNSTRTGRSGNLSTLSSSASSVSHSSGSSNWRHSTLTTSSATSGFTRYSNGSVRSVSTVATSVSGGSGSWRHGNASNASLASADRKPAHYYAGGPPSIASRNSDKSSLSGMPPPNVKIMTGVPWALDELPRQLHPNPSGDIFGMPPATPRKQRVRKPKDLPTINERPGYAMSSKAPPTKSPLSQRFDAGRSSTSLHRHSSEGEEGEERADGTPRKVQKGQINALAKMLSALRR